MQLESRKNEPLFLVIINKSNDSNPGVYIETWEKAMETFESFCTERDDDQFFTKVVKKEIRDDRADATAVENHKGWGFDYMKTITIKPAYYFG